jgi:D-alanyl-D-alanine carboxypeptidase
LKGWSIISAGWSKKIHDARLNYFLCLMKQTESKGIFVTNEIFNPYHVRNKPITINKMKKTGLFLLFFAAFCISNASAQLNPNLTARLQFVLDSTCAHYKIKGASAAVLVPGIGTWKGTSGVSHPGEAVTSDMLFGIGSNTKTYTSAIMLKLQEMGKLSINDTIGKWIAPHKYISGKITIKQILNHTSGIFSFTDNPNFNDSMSADFKRIWKPAEILDFILAPDFQPGKSWNYSNSNYLIAGIIISKVMNQPYEVVLRNFIFNPQGFNNSIFFPEETTKGTIAFQWSMGVDHTTQRPLTDIPGYSNNSMFSFACSAGAIMQTAEDNVNFWYNLYNDKIINAASFNQMIQGPFIGSSASGYIKYGLGIFKYQNFMNGHTIYTHGGTNIGFINENAVDTVTGICFSVLTNQDSVSNDILLTKVIGALQKATLNTKLAGIDQGGYALPEITMYPNPASDQVTINVSGSDEPYFLRVYDLAGRIVLQKEIRNNASIGISELQAGAYIARVSRVSGGLVNIQKVVVNR